MKFPRWLRWRSFQELDQEIQVHLDLATRAGIERGLQPKEAHLAARREMGNRTRLLERAREADPLFRFESIARDLHYAVRNLRRRPGFTLAAILSLALGIGVNCTVFSFSDALLLQPLDVPHSDELVQVFSSTPRSPFGALSYQEYAAYRDGNRTLDGLMTESFRSLAIRSQENEQARLCPGNLVSGNYLSVLQTTPRLGRSFLPEEDSPSAKGVVTLVSYEIWQATFHSDPEIVGKAIELNGQPATVIGVLPEGFRGTGNFVRADFYVPLAAVARLFPSDKLLTDPRERTLPAYGRLRRGVSARTAQADFATLTHQMEQAFPAVSRKRTAVVLPILAGRLATDPDDARLIFFLLSIAAAVLIVASLNVANLLLGRASARLREMTIRQSLGASRIRLIRQFLTESLLLAALGASAGMLLSWSAVHYFASIPLSPDLPGFLPVRLDGRVLGYALLSAVAATLIAGLWPAIRATRIDLISPAKGEPEPRYSRSFGGRNVLVATQIALATTLLVASALFAKSFFFASSADPGFRVENVLVMSFDPSAIGYTDEQTREFYQSLEERVGEIPGVRSAALGSHIPMGSNSQWNNVTAETGSDAHEPLSVMFSRVEPAYFPTMAVRIRDGRAFDEHDTAGAPAVAVVNEALAHRFWPDKNAVGQRVRLGDGSTSSILQVVGIAENEKYQSAIDKFEPYLYLPYRQHPGGTMALFVYTAVDPLAAAPSVRAEVKAHQAEVPVLGFHTMKEIFEVHGLLSSRLMAQLVAGMGGIGLALSLLGVYAVMAFAVSRRMREIGIRMALGARAGSVLRQVLGSGAMVTLAGLAVGLAGAFSLTWYVSDFLIHVDPHDPVAFLGASLLLLAAALSACWVPARKASQVDPAITLRYE